MSGSIEQSTQPMWVLDASTKRIVKKQTTYVPGLFKIFDEIMVNAADNKQRDPSMTTIKVDIDRETNTISVANDGKGIPVQIHSEHNCYVPELIFGHLLTGSNFDDDEKEDDGREERLRRQAREHFFVPRSPSRPPTRRPVRSSSRPGSRTCRRPSVKLRFRRTRARRTSRACLLRLI